MTRLSDAWAVLFGQYWRTPRDEQSSALSADEREQARIARKTAKMREQEAAERRKVVR